MDTEEEEQAVSVTMEGPLNFIAYEIRPLKNALSVPIDNRSSV
jgi:hypothetical protein